MVFSFLEYFFHFRVIDILYYANWESDDVIRFAHKVIKYKNISISEMKKDIPKMKMPSLVFQISGNYFSFHGHFK